MTRCLDIHTHHPAPQPEAVVSSSIHGFDSLEGQLYSVGIHPWESDRNISEEEWHELEKIAQQPNVVAIGEAGIDKIKGGALYQQILVFKRQINLSEKLGKPLIIHDVKAHDVIVGLKKNIRPKQNWVVHGFRGKPSVARMLTNEGIYLSFGEKFNPDTPSSIPENMILAETDESPLTIEEIIDNLSFNLGKDVTYLISNNSSSFLNRRKNI